MIRRSPRWYTVAGGSHEDVRRVAAGLDQVCTDTEVTAIREIPDGVQVTDGNGRVARFDAVVVATQSWPAVVAGMLVWTVGWLFEVVGDRQLAAYEEQPRDRHPPVLDTGL